MTRRLITVAAMASILAFATPSTAEDIDPADVKRSIDQAVKYLKGEQKDNGSWPAWLNHDTTGLCALALLNAGVEPTDDCIQRALVFLRNLKPKGTYDVALQTMVFCTAEPRKNLTQIRANAAWLTKTQIKARGTWSYPGGNGDNSNTQFALLGLWEAERTLERYEIESPIPRVLWERALTYWQTSQNADGSWGYGPGVPGSGSMTCAGISSVVICLERLNKGGPEIKGDQVQCCGDLPNTGDHVARALRWLGRPGFFTVRANPGRGGGIYMLYYLYGLERVGRLTAQRLIGKSDWYREGVKELLTGGAQDPFAGYFKGNGHAEERPHIATSFALLFLAKGRRPVLLSKTKHGRPGNRDWDNRPGAVGKLTRYVESKWRRDLTWQVVDSTAAVAEDYLQSPVIFLSSGKPIQFTDDHFSATRVAELRKYLDRGGFLFAEACCDEQGKVDASFHELMRRVFPEPEFQLRPLAPDHEIWNYEERAGGAYRNHLYGVSVGCRMSVVYSDLDLSCYWDLFRSGGEREIPDAVQQRVDTALSLGINVLAYATNRELKFRYENFRKDSPAKQTTAVQRALLVIPKLRHGGGWNAAPGALAALQRELSRETGVLVPTDQRELDITDKKIFDHHLLFMHGRNSFSLSEEQRTALRVYLERGGMIFADAVCASEAFAASFRKEMAAILPNQPLERIPTDHKMFSTAYDGFDLKEVTRHIPSAGGNGRPLKRNERKAPPHLEGIKLEDRYAVIFSKFDLSCALESRQSVQCEGYIRADAARIAINVVLYSLHE